MTKTLLKSLLLLGLMAGAFGFGLDLSSSDTSEDEVQGRFFPLILNNNGGNVATLNVTVLAALAAALASAFMSLLNLVGLGLLMAQNMNDDQKDTHYHHDSGHSSYRRLYDTTMDIDWEALSLSEWISLIMETYHNFNPSDIECQKRFICEIHQKTKELGPIAEDLTFYFSYLRYGEVFSLPVTLKMLIEDYIDAADKGKTLHKDCGDMFTSCDFSVSEIIDRYKPNKKKGKETHQIPNHHNYIK